MRKWQMHKHSWLGTGALLLALGCGTAQTTNTVAPGATNATDTATQDSNTQDTATQDTASAQDTAPTVDAAEETLAQTEDVAQDVAKPLPQTSGNFVEPGQGLPEFAQVVDASGAPVTQDQLVGKWTVMWFYPAAQTAG